MKNHTLGAALAVLAAGAILAAALWLGRGGDSQSLLAPEPAPTPAPLDRVELSSAKIAAAQLRLAPLAVRRLQSIRRVPGRIEYDASNHVAVRAPADGVLTEVLVQPADVATKGQTLAWLSSKEVGEARADVLRRQDERKLAQTVQQREEEVFHNLQELIPQLRDRAAPDEIERRFAQRSLGEFGEKLLSAYSQLLLAEELYRQGQAAGGALAAAVQRERQSNREVALARFNAAIEAARFESRRRRDEAVLAAEDARRRGEVSRQRLRLLAGDEGADAAAADDLSLLAIRAPVSGTIEERFFARTERVEAGATLFVIADPATLWVSAAVRENEWEALQLSPGAELTVEPAAAPGRRLAARVVYVGRNVEPGSHAVPVVASISNGDGQLRPGMYATVWLPLGPPIEALAVPPSAVMRHEGESFVFVADGPQAFRRVTVETGRETEDWIEIREGLTAGMVVVEHGAFVLKSELLLEREAD